MAERPRVSELARVRMTADMARGRTFTIRRVPFAPPEPLWTVSRRLGWTDGTWTEVTLEVVRTRQRLAGCRWWWVCPGCGRRCLDILSAGPESPFRCRKCWGATYEDKRRPLKSVELLARSLGTEPDPIAEMQERFDHLTATRRRGVRRGRRVRLRAVRLLAKMLREQRRVAASMD